MYVIKEVHPKVSDENIFITSIIAKEKSRDQSKRLVWWF